MTNQISEEQIPDPCRREHVIFWVTRHDAKLPHDFLERGADREIYSLINHGYFDSSRIGKQADSIGLNQGCFLHGSVATLQSSGDRLAGCSSWHLRFVV